MTVASRVEAKLGSEISGLRHFEITNESGRHAVPPGSESHFKVTLVSDSFAGMSLVARHRKVYGILAAELANGIHALALHIYTEAEWRAKTGGAPMSPPCLGGSKEENNKHGASNR